MSCLCIIMENSENPPMVGQYPVARPVVCLDHGVPFLVPEFFDVSLTIANRCVGQRSTCTPPTSHQSRCGSPSFIAHPFFVPAALLVHHCHNRSGFGLLLDQFGDVAHTSDVGRPNLLHSELSHVSSCCVQFCRVQVQCAVFGIEELFLVYPFVGIQRTYPIWFSPCHKCWMQTPKRGAQMTCLQSLGCEYTRLLVSYALDDDPKGMPHSSATTNVNSSICKMFIICHRVISIVLPSSIHR